MLEIRVKVLERQTKEGKKFNVYKAVQPNGTFVDLKFRREVKDLPTVESFIYVLPENINLNENSLYPTLWVKKVERITEYKPPIKEDVAKISEMFKVIDDPNNPF